MTWAEIKQTTKFCQLAIENVGEDLDDEEKSVYPALFNITGNQAADSISLALSIQYIRNRQEFDYPRYPIRRHYGRRWNRRNRGWVRSTNGAWLLVKHGRIIGRSISERGAKTLRTKRFFKSRHHISVMHKSEFRSDEKTNEANLLEKSFLVQYYLVRLATLLCDWMKVGDTHILWPPDNSLDNYNEMTPLHRLSLVTDFELNTERSLRLGKQRLQYNRRKGLA